MMQIIYKILQITLENGLFWHEIAHALFAFPLCLILWKKTKRLSLALIPLIFAYFLDMDHLFDYWVYYGFVFNLPDFFRMEYFNGPGRAFIPFHAFEWVIIMLLFSIRKGWNSKFTAVNLGVFAHLLLDAISVYDLLFYFISYRFLFGFRIFL